MPGEPRDSTRRRTAKSSLALNYLRIGGRTGALHAVACFFLACVWLVTAPGSLFSQDTLPSMPGKAGAGLSKVPRTRAESNSTSPTTTKSGPDLSKVFQLGALGGNWVKVYAAKLRGDMAQANVSTENNQITHLTMVGLIRIESEKLTLECENLKYDNTDANRTLEARYNVHVDLHDQGIKADCGLLVYDLVKNVITLSVDPYVLRKTPDGETEIKNWKTITVTLKPDAKYEIAVQGEEGMIELNPSGSKPAPTKSADHATTPGAPREITPGTLGTAVPKTATPTLKSTKK